MVKIGTWVLVTVRDLRQGGRLMAQGVPAKAIGPVQSLPAKPSIKIQPVQDQRGQRFFAVVREMRAVPKEPREQPQRAPGANRGRRPTGPVKKDDEEVDRMSIPTGGLRYRPRQKDAQLEVKTDRKGREIVYAYDVPPSLQSEFGLLGPQSRMKMSREAAKNHAGMGDVKTMGPNQNVKAEVPLDERGCAVMDASDPRYDVNTMHFHINPRAGWNPGDATDANPLLGADSIEGMDLPSIDLPGEIDSRGIAFNGEINMTNHFDKKAKSRTEASWQWRER